MLILAGVSISAIVGDNGVLTKTTYASFLSEMSAVEEAVQLWKAGEIIEAQGDEVKAIPANGLCNANDLTSSERLVGEVGYYRVWSLTSTMPTTDILSSADTFNSSFESELVFYPAGVQDLYYLNNDALEIKGNKTYLIDATTGMIYSMTGISLKGVRCYSLNMAKAVMNGSIEQPLFAEAEVSGTGSGEKLAGNVQSEYLMDENGNYILDENGNKIKNPDYNPNGFQIIAHHSNDNVYKLYNNGDLYGKGKKGLLLSSSQQELEEINNNVFKKLTIPSEIPGATTNNVKVVLGYEVIYVIDSNKDLWAWGNNSNNWLGLTKEQQVEYTGRSPVKLSFNKNVENVFPSTMATYVLTNENNNYKLYACGWNGEGQIGNGKIDTYMYQFEEIAFPNPENIYKIYSEGSTGAQSTLIFTKVQKNNKEYIEIYFAGYTGQYSYIQNTFRGTEYVGKNVKNFIRINNGELGTVEPTRMVGYYVLNMYDPRIISVDENGKAYWYNIQSYNEITFDGSQGEVNKVSTGSPGVIILKRTLNNGDVQFWAYDRYDGSHFYTSYSPAHGQLFLLNTYFPTELDVRDIIDFGVNNQKALYFITNDGKLFASGREYALGINSELSNPSANIIECTSNLGFRPMEIFNKNYNTKYETTHSSIGIKDNNDNIYLVNASDIVLRDLILQTSWKKIASNVKYFNAEQSNNCMAYIDKMNDLWVIGSNPLNVGAGNETSPITEFKMLKSFYNTTSDTYKHLDGKVSKYKIASTCFYILTNGSDNNTLYCAGDYLSYGWTKYSYLGTGLDEVAKEPTKLLENIIDIEASALERTALSHDTTSGNYTLYYWGRADGGAIIGSSLTPVEWTGSADFFDGATDARLYQISYDKNYIYMETNNDCKLAVCGRNSYGSVVNGLGYNSYNKYTALEYDGQNKIKDFAILGGGQGGVFITKQNEVFGFGHENNIGIGSESTDRVELPIRLNMPSNNIVPISIVCSSQGYIITTSDGKVYGTGYNQYGTLGRWIGIDRNSPNSRYKTAFDWVECPELEI